MHILLTNDDGPPSPQASPYVQTFIKTLTSPPFSHTVSVVLPTTQRSWIGKAHLLPPSFYVGGDKTRNRNEDVTDIVQPLYYDPLRGEVHQSLAELRLTRAEDESKSAGSGEAPQQKLPWPDYYVLVPGTPATCAQLGLFHHDLLFPDFSPGTNTPNTNAKHSPIDLILSGPNYGRNTTAAFALSSGTIGGAMEGAVCGIRAIALSFAFFTRQETEAMVSEASTLGIRICETLMADWKDNDPTQPDLYSINIPLTEGINDKPVRWTWMLDNKWSTGSLYKNIPPAAADRPSETGPGDASYGTVTPRPENDLGARSGIATVNGMSSLRVASFTNLANGAKGDSEISFKAPMFRWQPEFGNIWSTVENSGANNDGLVIRNREASVTPLKAVFQGMYGMNDRFQGELKL